MRDGLQFRGKLAHVDQDRWREVAVVLAALVVRAGPVPVVDVEAFRGVFIPEYGGSTDVVPDGVGGPIAGSSSMCSMPAAISSRC
jgi:hypothetical protein